MKIGTEKAFPVGTRPTNSLRTKENKEEGQSVDLEDRVMVGLTGALPVIGGAFNLGYGLTFSALSQDWKLGAISLAGAAANFASLPLLAGGNYLGALGLLAISGASVEHVHRNW